MLGISVVIPTYNRAGRVKRAIDSALHQSCPPDEIVVVDDGSTDETPEIVGGMPDPVRYVRKENEGVSAARNRGVKEAKNDWVALLDSDDRWHPVKLEVQKAVLGDLREAVWCLSNACMVTEEETGTGERPDAYSAAFPVFEDMGKKAEHWFGQHLGRDEVRSPDDRPVAVYFGDLFPLLLSGNFLQPSGLLIRKSVYQEVGGFDPDLRVANDTDFGLRLAATGEPAAVIMRPLYDWIIGSHESLTSSPNTIRLIRNALFSLERAVEKRGSMSSSEQEAYSTGRTHLLRRLAYTLLTDLERKQAREVARTHWIEGGSIDFYLVLLWLVSYSPRPLLQAVRELKKLRE